MKDPWARTSATGFGRKTGNANSKPSQPVEQPAFPASRSDGDSLRSSVQTGISKARAAGAPLTRIEKAVFFSDAFDSYFGNGGFDAFIAEARSEENLDEYISALTALGLNEIATSIENGERKYAALDVVNESLWGKVSDSELSRPYLDVAREITTHIQNLNVNIEDVIERYVDTNYPWKQA